MTLLIVNPLLWTARSSIFKGLIQYYGCSSNLIGTTRKDEILFFQYQFVSNSHEKLVYHFFYFPTNDHKKAFWLKINMFFMIFFYILPKTLLINFFVI